MTNASPSSPAASARATRWMVAIAGGLLLLLVAGFIAMVVFVKDEVKLNAIGPVGRGPGAERGGLVFQGTLNVWEIHGRMAIDAGNRAHFELDMRGPSGQPAPPDLDFSLALAAADGSRPPLPMPHKAGGFGSYTADVQLPAAGPWQLRVAFPGVTGILGFAADE
ncbi:AAA family ATPase [Cognatazoarcus halotolerans]|uniref:AAA family ATPase n=1 Tax=Cognatazoarcus halotolerans TaxID=2686016 RepID=UPI00135A3D2F|nr:AAA family ATPase [Cognatazoarcus halotolerans]MCB1900286.1 AAA family ATPase [Rhodocyclaceae bacterium]MCP5310090.1 AAA family ATPase [Zoogloeaceae bacterium]